MIQAQQLAESYAAVWNESDAESRLRTIAKLWRPDGVHYASQHEARGHAALAQRITASHEKNVRGGGYRFRARENAKALHGAIAFNWEMIAADGRSVAAVGLEFLILDEQGRILVDYQFIVA